MQPLFQYVVEIKSSSKLQVNNFVIIVFLNKPSTMKQKKYKIMFYIHNYSILITDYMTKVMKTNKV